jgi:hypothetical protein
LREGTYPWLLKVFVCWEVLFEIMEFIMDKENIQITLESKATAALGVIFLKLNWFQQRMIFDTEASLLKV